MRSVVTVLTEAQLRTGLAGLKLPDEIVNALVETKMNAAIGAYDVVSGDVERLAGRKPRSFCEIMSTQLA